MSNEDDIKAFERLEAAGNGDNLQEQIRETARDPDELESIKGLIAKFGEVMPDRPPEATLVFAEEQERVKKRNVLSVYVEGKDTYTAEVMETTVTRFATHEPCVEHLPATFEDDVDEKGRLQALLEGENPEGVNYTQYRNSEENGRFGF